MKSSLALLVVLPLLVLVSLSVFGGGQIFMPIFNWLWVSLSSWFGIKIPEETISTVFAISNITPGILSAKFAAITGYLVANGQWWGFIALFITFLIFALPPILVMYYVMKYVTKFENSLYLKKLINIMNPVVVGIIVALAIQLFLNILLPNFSFNKSLNEYFLWNNGSQKSLFFVGWRKIVAWVYIPVSILVFIFAIKKKFPIMYLILGNIILALLIFEPWIN